MGNNYVAGGGPQGSGPQGSWTGNNGWSSGPYNNGQAPIGPPPRKSSTGLILIILLCIFIVLIVIAVIGTLFFRLSRDNQEVPSDAALSSSTAASLSTIASDDSDSSPHDVVAQGDSSDKVPASCYELPLIPGLEEGLSFPGDDGFLGATYVLYCDGKWAQTGYGKMTWGPAQEWNGVRWESIPYDENLSNDFLEGCYWRETLTDRGAPDVYLENTYITFCEDISSLGGGGNNSSGNRQDSSSNADNSSNSSVGLVDFTDPVCDGRYILIAESVVVPAGQDAATMINQSLANHPGASVARPGACPSLRAVEPSTGGYVYPIYYDYGFDADSACSEWRARKPAADVRILTYNPGEYKSPC